VHLLKLQVQIVKMVATIQVACINSLNIHLHLLVLYIHQKRKQNNNIKLLVVLIIVNLIVDDKQPI